MVRHQFRDPVLDACLFEEWGPPTVFGLLLPDVFAMRASSLEAYREMNFAIASRGVSMTTPWSKPERHPPSDEHAMFGASCTVGDGVTVGYRREEGDDDGGGVGSGQRQSTKKKKSRKKSKPGSADVEKRKRLMQSCVVGPHTRIGAGVALRGCVIFDHCSIGAGTTLIDCVLTQNTHIDPGVHLTNCQSQQGSGKRVLVTDIRKAENDVVGDVVE